jgi:hypothetical protein
MPVYDAEAATVIKGMMPRTKIILFSMHFDYSTITRSTRWCGPYAFQNGQYYETG